MKPVVIIAIAVVCSVAAVLGVLVVLEQVTTNQAQQNYDEFQRDVSLANSYNLEYTEIKRSECLDFPPPTTYSEAEQAVEYFGQKLREVAEAQKRMQDESTSEEWESGDSINLGITSNAERLTQLENNMQNLQEKWPNYVSFSFDTVYCPYEEEWEEAKEKWRNNNQ